MSWVVPRFDHLVDFAGASHAGRQRPNNEDVWRVDPGLGVFVVADGIGGHAGGEIAAKIAVDQIFDMLRTQSALQACNAFFETPSVEARRTVFDVLSKAVQRAHAMVLEAGTRDAKYRNMGCTLDVAILLGTRCLIAHVGDGRVYLCRPATTIQLTHDHTLHGSLLAGAVITPSRPPGPQQEVLTNAVGRKGSLRVEEVYVDLAEGDRILLCSDGVHGEIPDEHKLAELARSGPPDDSAVAVVSTALTFGGRDNATALVIAVGPRRPERAAAPAGLPARDASFAHHSTLFAGVPGALVTRALSAAVEVEFKTGAGVPRFFAGDRVGYIVLDGRVESPNGWAIGPSGLVYPESLAGGGREGMNVCKAGEPTRALRIRANDFREICASDLALAASVYERLAHVLARIA